MSVIRVQNLSKRYGEETVLKDINFAIEEGEFVVLLGASGCGKTTILKMINKIIPLTKGFIEVRDRNISEWNTIELRRSIGYVIQQIGLFPHMTIEENIAYVLSIMGVHKTDYKKRAKELCELVGLDASFLERHPHQLSGGQGQRIGVARALAANPDIVLMDEPFGAVDEITRRYLQDELKSIHSKLKKTFLFVTHDIEEALYLGNRIILIKDGEIEQIGTPKEIIFHPKSDYVKSFFGIKGFKASLPEDRMKDVYDAILSGRISLSEALDRFDIEKH